MMELSAEALILCLVGGTVGIILGFAGCAGIQPLISQLPLRPTLGDAFSVFPVVTLLSFTVTAAIGVYFVGRVEDEPIAAG